jgi:RimJ/RimL family protein N-acetyltransferase
MSTDWQPGQRVAIETDAGLVRSLLLRDLTGDVERWSGAGERSKNLWKPELPPRVYLERLIEVCDQRRTFVLGIFPDRAREAAGEPIGYLKLQLGPRPGGLEAIPTVVIGEPRLEGHGVGSNATRAVNYFALTRLGATQIAPPVYAENVGVVRLLLASGYAERLRYRETAPSGSEREVLVLSIAAADWHARLPSAAARFHVRALAE